MLHHVRAHNHLNGSSGLHSTKPYCGSYISMCKNNFCFFFSRFRVCDFCFWRQKQNRNIAICFLCRRTGLWTRIINLVTQNYCNRGCFDLFERFFIWFYFYVWNIIFTKTLILRINYSPGVGRHYFSVCRYYRDGYLVLFLLASLMELCQK